MAPLSSFLARPARCLWHAPRRCALHSHAIKQGMKARQSVEGRNEGDAGLARPSLDCLDPEARERKERSPLPPPLHSPPPHSSPPFSSSTSGLKGVYAWLFALRLDTSLPPFLLLLSLLILPPPHSPLLFLFLSSSYFSERVRKGIGL